MTRAGLLKFRNFYPRPPRGGRHGKVGATTISSLFLSTPSARRATAPPFMVAGRTTTFLSTPSARRATGDCIPYRPF